MGWVFEAEGGGFFFFFFFFQGGGGGKCISNSSQERKVNLWVDLEDSLSDRVRKQNAKIGLTNTNCIVFLSGKDRYFFFFCFLFIFFLFVFFFSFFLFFFSFLLFLQTDLPSEPSSFFFVFLFDSSILISFLTKTRRFELSTNFNAKLLLSHLKKKKKVFDLNNIYCRASTAKPKVKLKLQKQLHRLMLAFQIDVR